MKTRAYYLYFIVFSIASTALAKIESEPLNITAKQDPSVTITTPAYIPVGAFKKKETMVEYAYKASIPVLVDYYRTVWGISFGASPSIEIILNTLKSYRKKNAKKMDRAAQKIKDQYYEYMKIAEDELNRIWDYFPPNKEQVNKLVAVNLEPYFEKVDTHLRGTGLSRMISVKKYAPTPAEQLTITSQKSKTLEITRPVFIPKDAFEKKQDMIDYEYESSRLLLIDHLSKKGISFGKSPTIEIILDTLKSFRKTGVNPQEMDQVARKIKRDYYRYMRQADKKLDKVWRFFSPNKDQIDKFVLVNLEPYLIEVDKHLREVRL